MFSSEECCLLSCWDFHGLPQIGHLRNGLGGKHQRKFIFSHCFELTGYGRAWSSRVLGNPEKAAFLVTLPSSWDS
eukprot:gene21644-biopygen7494